MSTPDFEATTRDDSLGIDEQDPLANQTEDAGTLADGAEGTNSSAVSDSSIADYDDGTADTDGADAEDPDILAVDTDEYSDEPHMGSVPRVLGEDEYMPDTQGEDPIYAELGDEGQGDLAPEDL
ncbi:sugar ABC transporter ATPase [Microbacterium sp. 4R-513]|uniref:sugar ABC transporter ATPase n=1 Tax=Microbacterium sp. 4R-513 TaxID=2567934 RepID=UPI001F4952A1|nr:sugar ABC transporter ATPase [Microbacterium sp. 4R-513]